MNHMEINEWFNALTDGATTRSAGTKIGVSHTTISRQLRAGELSAEVVIALCRAYDRSPVDGLVETGYLFPHEIHGVGVEQALDMATNQQVLALIERRITVDDDRDFRAGGDSNVIGLHRPVEFDPMRDVATADDQDALRYPESDDHP